MAELRIHVTIPLPDTLDAQLPFLNTLKPAYDQFVAALAKAKPPVEVEASFKVVRPTSRKEKPATEHRALGPEANGLAVETQPGFQAPAGG